MKKQIVIGHLFGDEGKGIVVNWLCAKAFKRDQEPVVYLSSGGSQNAHTVEHNGIKHVFSSFGSGTLAGASTILGPNYMLDPICAMNEYKALEKLGYAPHFYINPLCRIITPYDVEANRNNFKNLKDGSCGKGIFMTFQRNKDGVTFRWYDCKYVYDNLRSKLYRDLERIAEYYCTKSDENLNNLFIDAVEFLKSKVDDNLQFYNADTVIYECSQGLLLDMDYGIDWPHVTPSWTSLDNFDPETLRDSEVFLVSRTFTTRHGASGIKLYNHPEAKFEVTHETNITNQYQGNFKTGILDINLMNRAWDRHGFDKYVRDYNIKVNLCISHIDTFYDSNKHSNYFPYIGKRGFTNKYINTEKDILKCISEELIYKPDNIFWSNTPEGKYRKI